MSDFARVPKDWDDLHNYVRVSSAYVVAEDLNAARDQIEAQAKEIAELRAALAASPQTLRLHLGEMTAQEMRTVRAAFSWVLAKAAG